MNFIVFQSIHSSEEAELAEQCYSGLTLTGSQALTPLLAYTPHLSWKGDTLGRTGMRKLWVKIKMGRLPHLVLENLDIARVTETITNIIYNFSEY